jgi:phospholipase A1
MLRPASEGSAVELTWSRKISRNWRVYAQYWNGYAESLIDYDFRTKRIGIGFALSDYLER